LADLEGGMLRVLLYVSLLAALFVGSVLWAGNAIGAFEPPNLPAHAPGVSTEKAKAPTPHHRKHKRN
jgi:hypothetical protein